MRGGITLNELIKIMLLMLLILFILTPKTAVVLTFFVIGIVIGLLLTRIVKSRKEK